MLAVAAAIILTNVFIWSRITENRAWLLEVLVAGTAVFCIVLMLFLRPGLRFVW